MTKLNLPYVQRFKDRHGKVRHYFRRAGYPRVQLPGKVGSPEFMATYEAAISRPLERPQPAATPGSISALLVAYYASAGWQALKPQTQANYRNILERFRDEFGERPAAALTARHVEALIEKRADKPGATRNLIKRLRSVYDVGLTKGLVTANPFKLAKLPKEGKGFRTWTEDDIERFLAYWAVGTRARLALVLLLYTGQRRSDVVRMGRQHVRDGFISVTQEKTGTALEIAVHPTLRAELDALPLDNLTFLMTAYGKPMTRAGFTQWFVECAKEAGLPDRSGPHGLRKAAARRLAEAGCSPHEIAAITGHTSLREVERYTKAVERKKLSASAVAKLK